MGYNPIPPPPMWTDQQIVEREINQIVGRYISGHYDETQLEEYIEFWLKWETLGPIARRNYELDWTKEHADSTT